MLVWSCCDIRKLQARPEEGHPRSLFCVWACACHFASIRRPRTLLTASSIPLFVSFHASGVRTNSWTDLCRDSKTLPVFDGAEGTERDLDTLCVIPADIRVNDFNELINCRGPPVTWIE